MPDIAALGFAIDSKPLADANKELAKLPAAAGGAEQAVKKLDDSSKSLAVSTEGVTRKIARNLGQYALLPDKLQAAARATTEMSGTTAAASRAVTVAERVIASHSAAMSAASAEQERYSALRRAGITIDSAAGSAVSKTVKVLEDQQAAQHAATDAARQATEEARRAQQAAGEAARVEQQRSDSIRRVVADLDFERAQLGRTAAEQERYNALRRAGVTPESPAGQEITANVSAIQAHRQAQLELAEATRQAAAAELEQLAAARQQAAGFAMLARQREQEAAEAARAELQRTEAIRKVVDGLEFERAQLGRTATERAQYEALKRAGVSAASADGKAIMATVANLELEREALRKAEAARLSAGKASTVAVGMTAQQRLMLSYQLNDIFTSVVGGMNPAMIAAQQGPQITQVFGGLKPTFDAIPRTLLAGFGAALAAGLVLAVVNGVAKMQDALEEQQRRLKTLFGSQTEAAQGYRDIAKFASEAGIGIDAAAASFVAFGKATQGLGASRQNVADIASIVGKLSQISGASKEDGGAAQQALVGMLKESTVNADQLRTVLGTVPQIADRIAAGLGVSVTQLRLMADQGELGNRQVFNALLKQSATVSAEFAKMPKSIGSQFTSLADDMGQVVERFANLIPLVREYRLAIELAAKGAKALNEVTTPATPQQRMEAAGGPSVYSDQTNRIFRRGNNPGEFYSAQFDQGVADNQATFAALGAQAKAVNDNVVNAMAIADKLDPLGRQFRESAKNIGEMEEALADLQGSLKGVSAEEAARQMGVLENAINRAKAAARGLDPALRALNDIELRNRFRANDDTPAGMAVQTRTQELVTAGSNAQDAQTAALAEQQERIADIIKAKQDEAEASDKITAATGRGKAALIEAQVEAAKLAFITANIGKNTEGWEKEIAAFTAAVRTSLNNQATQASIDASRPLITELAGIAAAADKVTYGMYAMAKARAEAVAARDENGTGQLQMQVFEANQILADAQSVVSLKLQIDLTNKLAAAAGDVARQKKIQLDHDIMLAKSAAHPDSGSFIEEQMRAKATADDALAYGNIIAQSKEFVAQQEVEQAAAFATAEGAARLRFEYQLLNQAKQAGIELTPERVQAFKDEAAAMAAAQVKAQQFTDLVNLGKSTVGGFFSDMNQSLQQGVSVWDAFGNAATNALNKIADKLMQMAVDDLFNQAFGGSKGGSGGLLGGLFSFLGFGGSSVGSPGLPTTPNMGTVNAARGRVYDNGNVIPFARGGVVSRPTLFPMASGATGLMGEAGPEAIVPLHRDRNGSLGIKMLDAATPRVAVEVSLGSAVTNEFGRIAALLSRVPANDAFDHKATRRARDAVEPWLATGRADRRHEQPLTPPRRPRNDRSGEEPSGGGDVVVNIANYSDASVSAKKRQGPGGQLQVDVLVEAIEGKMSGRLSRGQGALGKTMEGTYGLQRVGR